MPIPGSDGQVCCAPGVHEAAAFARPVIREALETALRLVREALALAISGGSGGRRSAEGADGRAAAAGPARCSGELVQAELLKGLPEALWGVRPCGNARCARMDGACELEQRTMACGGGCGARYCCRGCQREAWRAGHGGCCAAMREMMVGYRGP